jgi:D-alanine-D-alanine ligase
MEPGSRWIIAEEFITGPRIHGMIVGSAKHFPKAMQSVGTRERVFSTQSLPDTEKFLSFDRLWEIYEEETPMPDDDNFYEYQSPDASLHAGSNS